MGIMDGAAAGLRARLEKVGVRPTLAVAIGQVAYIAPHKIPSWIAPSAVSKSEVTGLVSLYEKQLRSTPEELASIALIQGLCNRIFGVNGEQMFVGAYPEYSPERWAESMAKNLSQNMPETSNRQRIESADFSRAFVDSDIYWDGDEWVSASISGPGTDESAEEALTTSLTTSKAIAMLARKYFDTPRNGLGKYVRNFLVDETKPMDGLSLACIFMRQDGESFEGFLVQSSGGFGFFDGHDLMADDINDGSPLLFSAEDIIGVFCGIDEDLLATMENWSQIVEVPSAGRLELVIRFADDKALRLVVPPKTILTDAFRSRYFCAIHFINELDTRLASHI